MSYSTASNSLLLRFLGGFWRQTPACVQRCFGINPSAAGKILPDACPFSSALSALLNERLRIDRTNYLERDIMRIRIIAVTVLLFTAGCMARGQDSTRDNRLFVRQFPSIKKLEVSLSEYVHSLSAAEIESASGNSSGLHAGRWAALNSLVVDNLKLDVQGAYSDTLQRSLASDGQLSAFQLSGVKFVPTYSLTYELGLGQLTKAKRGWRSANQFRQDLNTVYQKQLATLHAAYAQFEELRAEFLAASPSIQQTDFYKLKEQAVNVLATAHYSEQVEEDWASREFVEPQAQEKSPTQTALLKK
jgi:hypothetical protein